MITFDIPGIGLYSELLPEQGFWTSVKKVSKAKGEAGTCNHQNLVKSSGMNPFVEAAYTAFSVHNPLSISPDDINLLIAQGLACHINQNAEALRSKIVAHEGKETIKVRRDDFVKGLATNPWQEVFPVFTRQIREFLVGDVYGLTVGDFSTTGPVEKAASEIVLMDAVQSYFTYEFHTKCGIPRFTLTGTPNDWKKIRDRATHLEEYGLGWWQAELLPLLDEFLKASLGCPDLSWWESFFKENNGSGGPYIGGHILRLFPYLWRSWKKDFYQNEFKYGMFGGPGTDSFPSGLSVAPFIWFYYEQVFPMEFVAGFVGIGQDQDTTIHPAIGWLVRDANK